MHFRIALSSLLLFPFLSSNAVAENPTALRIDYNEGEITRVLKLGDGEIDSSFAETLDPPDDSAVSLTVFPTPVDDELRGSTLTSDGRIGAVRWNKDGSLVSVRFAKPRIRELEQPKEVSTFADLFYNLHGQGAKGIRLDFFGEEQVRSQVIGYDRTLTAEELSLVVSGVEIPSSVDSLTMFFIPSSDSRLHNAGFVGLALTDDTSREIHWRLSDGRILVNELVELSSIENDAELNVIQFRGVHQGLREPFELTLPNWAIASAYGIGVLLLFFCVVGGIFLYKADKAAAKERAKKAADEALIKKALVSTPAPNPEWN